MTTWSTKQLATALRLTVQRVGQLVKAGILPTPERGHDPFRAVPAYIAFLSRRLTGENLKDARIAKYAVETAIKELEYKVRCHELVNRDAIEKEWFQLGREVRDCLFNIRPRVDGLLLGAARNSKDDHIARHAMGEILDRELTAALTSLSERSGE